MVPINHYQLANGLNIYFCPDKNKNPLAATAWLYGPIGAGALSVLTIFLFIDVSILNESKYIFYQPPIFAKNGV